MNFFQSGQTFLNRIIDERQKGFDFFRGVYNFDDEWISSFLIPPSVGALVTDAGGLLSHPVIIAREFGIPAVLATGNATMKRCEAGWLSWTDRTGTVEISGIGNAVGVKQYPVFWSVLSQKDRYFFYLSADNNIGILGTKAKVHFIPDWIENNDKKISFCWWRSESHKELWAIDWLRICTGYRFRRRTGIGNAGQSWPVCCCRIGFLTKPCPLEILFPALEAGLEHKLIEMILPEFLRSFCLNSFFPSIFKNINC